MNGIASSGDANKALGPEFSGAIGHHDYKQYVRATIVGANVDLGKQTGNVNTNLETTTKDEGSKLDVVYKQVNYKQAIDQINENGGVLNTLLMLFQKILLLIIKVIG